MNCPCQSNTKYSACCGVYHHGTLFPATAETLARARHSAIFLKKHRFLYDTWDKTTRPTLLTIKIIMPEKNGEYEITNIDMGQEEHDIGMVTCVSTFKQENKLISREDLCLFKRQDGKWAFHKSEAK